MVKVKFFAGLRERVGKEEIDIKIDETTVENLIDMLEVELPGIKEHLESGVTIAVNRNVAKPGDSVKDADVVAIFPPVSGG